MASIFDDVLHGKGLGEIAKELNRKGISGPTGKDWGKAGLYSILTIPVVSDYSNHVLAEQAASQTARWFWGYVISGVAFGVSILAGCSIARYQSMKGQSRTGIASLSLIAVGGLCMPLASARWY